jgi:hypothetical protein
MERQTIVIDCSYFKNNLKSYLENYKNTNIVYLHVTEYIGDIFSSHEKHINDIHEIDYNLKLNNNKLYVIFGGYKSYRYDLLNELNLNEIKFLFWPTFLLHYTFYMMEKKYGQINKIKNSFNKLYISLNQKPKQHRAMFIDLIHRNNLKDYGLFSWNELTNEWSNNYKFKHWDEKIVRLDINQDREFLDVRKDYFTDNLFNFGCLFNIIGESVDNNDMFFITEKTFKNLLIGQPFICIGSPYQNKILENFGFEIYNDLIDYSFDEKLSVFDRVEGVIQNIEKLKNKNPNELYGIIEKKVLHNIQNCYNILCGDNHIPKSLVSLYHSSPNSFKDYKDSYMDVHLYLNKILGYL